MMQRKPRSISNLVLLALVIASVCGISGCATIEPIPLSSICNPALLAPRDCGHTIDLTLLQKPQSDRYFVNVGDTLGLYIRDVLGESNVPGPVNLPIVPSARYPGQIAVPQLGVPLKVSEDGEITLPDVGRILVAGLSLSQIADRIRAIYIDRQILKEGKDYLTVTLIQPRTVRVSVFREDANTLAPTQVRRDAYIMQKRGTAEVLEMPATENDVLHALAATGGLPGSDAYNHVWVLRAHPHVRNCFHNGFHQQPIDESVLTEAGVRFTRIPLTHCPGVPLPFCADDVVLNDGDVVYVEARKAEFFYVGGLLEGGQIPLPRDYSVDILGAIALANGAVNGPTGGASNNFTTGPGNIIPPTKAIVSRRNPDGSIVLIEVDLRRALGDPNERLIIYPGDFVMLKYRPHEIMANIGMNIINFNFLIPSGS